MYKSLLLLCLVGVICAQNTNEGSTIKSIFDTSATLAQAPIITAQKPATTIQPVPQPQDKDWEHEPCTTRDGKDGICIFYIRCDINGTIINDGIGTIEIRSSTAGIDRRTPWFRSITQIHSSSDEEDECESYIDGCCNFPDAMKADNPLTPPPYKQIRNPDGRCGWSNPDGVDSNTTGYKDGESKFGEFPWMVVIFNIKSVDRFNPSGKKVDIYVGGGSLIHPAVVLTTAHHVDITEAYKVRAGDWNIKSVEEKYPYQDRDVDSIEKHKDFNTKRINLFYDVALLFLTSPMDTSMPNVGLACLPPPHQRTPGGVRCVASGWGKQTFEKESSYQSILKKVTVPVVERKQCQTQLRKTRLGHFFELHSSFICAGGEAGIDTCEGDGGSPLMCPIENEPNRYMQSGMVAWGIRCGEEGIPGVYVDVSTLRDWIDDKIVGKGLDPKAYTF